MDSNRLRPTWKGVLLVGLCAWAYLPTFRELSAKWLNDPQYSHGLLVPLFAALLLWRAKDALPVDPRPWPWAGLGVLLVALACRGAAAALYFLTLDGIALLLCIAGIVVTLGGGALLRWAWRPLVFLIFMVPLPYQVERMMGAELQRLGTEASTFLLQSFGQPAVSEGNTILIHEVKLEVVNACSGLRMLATFLAFAAAAVMLMERCWVVKALILASAVPIALVTNILRITATGMVHVALKDSPQRSGVLNFIHDFNGWMMMPVGLALLVLELWVFRHLLIEPRRSGS